MTPPKSIIRIALMTTGMLIPCAGAVLGLYIIAFTAFYLVGLTPHLLSFESLKESELYFETICSTYPGLLVDSIRSSASALLPNG